MHATLLDQPGKGGSVGRFQAAVRAKPEAQTSLKLSRNTNVLPAFGFSCSHHSTLGTHTECQSAIPKAGPIALATMTICGTVRHVSSHGQHTRNRHLLRGQLQLSAPPHAGHSCCCRPETLMRLAPVGVSCAFCKCRHHCPGHSSHLRQWQRAQQILQRLVLQPQLAGALAADGRGAPPSAHAVAEPGHAQCPLPLCLGECKLRGCQSLPSDAAMQLCAGCSIRVQDCREVAALGYVEGI